MPKCYNCSKVYKCIKRFNKHILVCDISNEDLDKCNVVPSRKEMWLIIQKLVKQNENLQKRMEDMEKIVNKDIKKINMIEWLNENVKLSINLDKWLAAFKITVDDVKYIFDTDFSRGLYRILDNNIEKDRIPLRAFNHKSKQLYVYHRAAWKKCTIGDIRNIFTKIQLEILKKNNEYEESLDESKIYGGNNMQYLINNEKIMIVKPKMKDRYLKYVEKTIIDLIRIDLNDMAKFQFYL